MSLVFRQFTHDARSTASRKRSEGMRGSRKEEKTGGWEGVHKKITGRPAALQARASLQASKPASL